MCQCFASLDFACMMCLLEKIACVLALSAWISAVLAIPAFEGVSTWSSIGSLVPGMSYLEALGPTNLNENSSPQYVSIAAPHGTSGYTSFHITL
ncbi:hypothetical protein PHLCEN_2v3869 [Hermanssonia centrifuga]|uniref:Uncharacterized protein n=1 Tax=Hermanssonia centrifuga TaxID=98765 RepID=A0A2R6QB82_9APHY|nr:hypothetical protein PHLCEN_2v3869 [Hermanssonia centrifuga]